MEYIIVLVIYAIIMVLGVFFSNRILVGLGGLAFLYPITMESNMIIILLSVIVMLFHFIYAFFSDKSDNSDMF